MIRPQVPQSHDDQSPSGEAAKRRPEFAEPYWRKERSIQPLRLRRLWTFCAGIGLIATVVLLVWVSTWLRLPRSVDLVLLGADYGDNLLVPHNTYGWNVLEDFATLTDDRHLQAWGTRLIKLAHPPLELAGESLWSRSLHKGSKQATLVYVSAHGAVDENGPYLLFNNAHVANDKGRLRLADVIDELSKLPPRRQKILVLDCTSMTSQWSLGILRNDFARALLDLEARIEAVPNLVVVCASSPDERNWTCDTWRQTVFGHYLLEGFKGGVADSNHDGRIDLWDLYVGVREDTNAWVQANRAARQTPMILPREAAGYNRARSIDLVPVPRHYQVPSPEAVASVEVPDEVVEAWKVHQRLAHQIPSPAVRAPFAWRRYRDLLIRYEELVLAGNRVDAANVRRRMLESQMEIDDNLVAGLSSVQNSLGMFDTLKGDAVAVPGQSQNESAPNVQKALESLWNAATGERAKQWDKLRGAAKNDPTEIQRLRMALQQLTIQRVSEAPAENLDTGSELIRLLDDPLHPRPAESHYLVMLVKDLPDTPWTDQRRDLVRLALSVRQLAERTAWNFRDTDFAFSERVFPHIQGLVERADRERRMGEDLLLSDSSDYDRAETHLQESQSTYQEAASRGAAVAAACGTYEEAMADLPYYAHWIARKRTDYRDNQAVHQKWLDRLEDLCRTAHQLGMTIDKEIPEDADGAAYVRALTAQTDGVAGSSKQFKQSLQENWQMMVSDDSPQAWCDMRDALRVPQKDYDLRMKLLDRLLQTERQSVVEPSAGQSRPSHITVEQQTERAKRAARAEGRMALAVLGRENYETLQGDKRLSCEEVLHCLAVFGVDEKWWQTVARAGHAIGEAWSRAPRATDKKSKAVAKADRRKGSRLLVEAESLSRLLPGYCDLTVVAEPAGVATRARLKELLEWQAQRTYDDHWYTERPKAEPYYRVAADAYLNDASVLFKTWPVDEALRKRVAAVSGLQFAVTGGLDVSSQRRVEVPVRLTAEKDADVPDGFPVVWFDVGNSLQLLQPGKQRTAWPWKASEKSNPLICDLESKPLEQAEVHPPLKPTVADTQLTLHGRFRGQKISSLVPIRLHLAPDIARSSYAPPQKASVAVRADEPLHRKYGDGNGTVAVVLDCTGSMGPPEGSAFSSTTKYAEATAALGRVLGSLPHGTTVSLWVFGQAVGQDKTVKEPEKTIRQILTPTSWDPGNPTQLKNLLAQIQYPALEPWNESPIVRAIFAAKKDLEKAQGFKTIVVLTDGIDNRVATDKETNPKGKDVPTLLRDSFRKSGIELNIVGFRMPAKEEAQGWKQFQVVRSLFPPGAFCTVSESESLAEALDAALRQRLRYWVETCNHQDVKGMPVRGLEVSRTGENNQWYPGELDPGNYFLQVNADEQIDKEIALNRGDHLLVRVAKTDAGLEMRQVAYGQEDFSWKPAQLSGAWRATLLQNQRIGNDRLQMLLGLEPNGEPSGKVLSIMRPDQAWIEILPTHATASLFRIDWSSCWGYPSAAWRLNVPQWPCDDQKELAGSQVKMWWSFRGGSAPDAVLHRPGDFANLSELHDREVVIRGQKVLVESVGVEDHAVQTGPDQRAQQTCLVVRLRYPSDQTVWVKPWGDETVGAEHRFYRDIGHYVGLFWPVTKDSVDESLRRLELISLETFKRSSQEHSNTIEFNKLPAPDPNDVGPQAVGS
jgi:hypothetical protein